MIICRVETHAKNSIEKVNKQSTPKMERKYSYRAGWVPLCHFTLSRCSGTMQSRSYILFSIVLFPSRKFFSNLSFLLCEEYRIGLAKPAFYFFRVQSLIFFMNIKASRIDNDGCHKINSLVTDMLVTGPLC